ncbi:uncharacterized protein V1518DRAFT_422766 [Limtongia smithiae]|uniref:uncharacterized protein n=1 Tax=Limtongia smithiae TaxID=1125753 RepID=UPI0034CFCD48
MSLRIVPKDSYATSVPPPAIATATVPALTDHLRANKAPAPIADTLNTAANALSADHPIAQRLEKWEETQLNLKLENLRMLFGTHEPVKRMMELEACKATAPFYPEVLRRADTLMASGAPGAGTDVATEILLGKDASVDWEDVYGGMMDTRALDFTLDLERRMQM